MNWKGFLNGSLYGLIEVLCQNFPEGIEVATKPLRMTAVQASIQNWYNLK
jgi:hypothetical protein